MQDRILEIRSLASLGSFTQAHLCDTPFCNVSRDNCVIPHKNKHKRVLRYYRYKYCAIWKVSLLGLQAPKPRKIQGQKSVSWLSGSVKVTQKLPFWSLLSPFLSNFPGRTYIRPPPSPHFWPKGVFLGRGAGVYILRPRAAGSLYAPLFYTPPTPRRVFSGEGGWGCIKFGPVNFHFHWDPKSHFWVTFLYLWICRGLGVCSPGRNYIYIYIYIYPPPFPPILVPQAFFRGGGWGCIFWRTGQIMAPICGQSWIR